MKKRKVKSSVLLAGVLLLAAVPCVLIGRMARQEKLNQALMAAIKQTNVEKVRILLKQGADPNARFRQQTGSLWQVVWRQLRHGGATPASDTAPNAIQYTLQNYMEYYIPDGPQPASGESSFRIVRLLIESGASAKIIIAINGKPRCLLTLTLYGLEAHPARQAMVRFLLQHGANVDGRENGISDAEEPPLLVATGYGGDEQSVKLLLDAGANVYLTNLYGATALQTASAYSSPQALKWLLERGAQVNGADKDGVTPLMGAVESVRDGSYRDTDENLAMLMAHGANIEAQDKNGDTALIDACRNMSSKLVRSLLKYHPRTNTKNQKGQTALMLADKSVSSWGRSLIKEDREDLVQERKKILRMLKQAGATE